jgi:hypothetical protein
LIEQRQRNLGLGLKRHLVWHAGFTPALWIVRPGLRQVQPHGHRPHRLRIGVATGHGDLTIADLPQGARVLPRHPHRHLALLGKTGVIQHQDTIAQGGFRDHLVHPLTVKVLCIPLHIGEELLQPLFTGAGHGLRHGIAVLVGQRGEQSRHIPLQGLPTLWPPEADLEGTQKVFQLRQLSRTGMHVHGYPPFGAEDTTS